MRKSLKKYANNLKIKKNYFKNTIKGIIKFFAFLFCVVFLIFLISPLFGFPILSFKQEKLTTEFYVVYTNTTSDEQDEIVKQSQKFRERGASGNITNHNNNTIIVLTECKNLSSAQKIIENLTSQDISANWYAQKIEINLKNFPDNQKQIIKEMFNTKISITNKIFEYVELLENKKITETDVAIEMFGFYSQLNALITKWEQHNNENIEKFLQQTISFQSHLFLLSQNKTENNFSFVSTIRYYLFKLINLI